MVLHFLYFYSFVLYVVVISCTCSSRPTAVLCKALYGVGAQV